MHSIGARPTRTGGRDETGGRDGTGVAPAARLRGACLPELLWRQAVTRPGGEAVVCGDERLGFRGLAERSAGVADHLRGLGVSADVRVGLFLDPSIELMVAVWGVLFAGGAYVPLAPEYPAERLRYMVADCGADIILTHDTFKERLAGMCPPGTTIVTVAEASRSPSGRERAGREQGRRPGDGVGRAGAGPVPEDLAYVIYTSGSTGRPKGVMIEHRAIVHQLRWLNSVHGIDRRRIVLQKTPISFDAAQWELLAPACGSTVVIGGPALYRDPDRMIDTIVKHGVTTLQCVPTLLQALLDSETFHTCSSLVQVFSGGEALGRTLALRFLDALPGCELINLYGPTECTINTSAHVVDRETAADGPHTIPIGLPADGTGYHILGDRLEPVAVGEIGELYISGAQLARGYLNRPGLTAASFVGNPFADRSLRLYKTGDLVHRSAGGTVHFVGRADNQVKVRGFRIELDEVGHAIETHDWVKNAAVVVRSTPGTETRNLVAFIELNPKEAALMDQGHHAAHHRSKRSRLQVRAQLSNAGCRDETELRGKETVGLPGATPSPEQRRRVFARKTYRFYEGGEVTRADVLRLLARRVTGAASRGLAEPTFAEFGEILRYFGRFSSDERLLPKYGYASPGALYATQMYLEIDKVAGLPPGFYYYDRLHHRLVLIRDRAAAAVPVLTVHFVGRRRAIEPVYRDNVREVLEIEAGHMVGLFEEILPEYGLDIRPLGGFAAALGHLECADDDDYLGAFEVVPYSAARPDDPVDLYVQAHPGKIRDLAPGLYRYADGELLPETGDIILKKHVIAINQRVYEASSLGIAMVCTSPEAWSRYLHLGRTLHRLQMNDLGLGFMPSGYSSETGHDLPAARRMREILRSRGRPVGSFYFCVGGRVSEEQVRGTGMKEDTVHMKGPMEMIREDLVALLPDYMIPNRIVLLDRLPLTPGGKIDVTALETLDLADLDVTGRPFITPRTPVERRIAEIWQRLMKTRAVSVDDDFFEADGNSLTAIAIVNAINKEFGCGLPLQVLFEAPTIEQLAARIRIRTPETETGSAPAPRPAPASRLVRLRSEAAGNPVFCWPGLGGYAMNLRTLAARAALDRPFYGVQAHGLNPGEEPYETIEAMAAADLRLIRETQPDGPYTLWGYSFGARVAFEVAGRLECSGARVEHLVLIAPGAPRVGHEPAGGVQTGPAGRASVDTAYLMILFSVFAGTVSGPLPAECLASARDEASLVSFVCERFPDLDPDLVHRITRIVRRTYRLGRVAADPARRPISAPVTVLRAYGDEISFMERHRGALAGAPDPVIVDLKADHYGVLKVPGADEAAEAIRLRLGAGT